MRWVRYEDGGRAYYGTLQEGNIREGVGSPFESWTENGHRVGVNSVRLLAPVVPSKILGVGLNYRDHAREMGKDLPEEPLFFLKAATSVIGPGETVEIPPGAGRVDFEGELALVIGRRASRVSIEEAADTIFGVTCFLDMTARDLQRKDVQYTRAKSFDTFGPIGPWIATEVDWGNLKIETRVNGERRQSSKTSQLVFPLPEIVARASEIMTLLPGDVITTGTPSGVGPVEPGDRIEVTIEEVGTLTVEVGE